MSQDENYRKALTKIIEAEDKNKPELFLNGLGLTKLPTEIEKLGSLITLDLSFNSLTNLPRELTYLTHLTTFYFRENNLKNLPCEIKDLTSLKVLDLRNNSLSSLPLEIERLKNLTSLSLDSNSLSSLPAEIGQLNNLTELVLHQNSLSSLPAEIGQLSNLTTLVLHNNSLSSLPAEIGQLTNLRELRLHNNSLSSLPAEIGQLTNLTRLVLSGNSLSSLPAEIGQLKKLETLLLHENEALGIPAELLGEPKYGNKEAQKILAYLRENLQGRPLNETKMLVVGQGGVGKTSLIRRLIDNSFDPNSGKTDGIDIKTHHIELKERTVCLNIWDFGGQEVMHATHQFFLTQRSLYLFVVDARIERDANKPDYWLNLIEQYGSPNAPIIIAINKIDDNPILSLNESALTRKYNIKKIIRTSCATGQGLAELEQTIQHEIDRLPHVSDSIPATWFNIKEALEREKQSQDIIEFTSYAKLCDGQAIVTDSRPILLELLHDLGTVLNFYGKASGQQAEPVLEDTHILNPEWVTDGVYAILNSEDVFDSQGVFDRNDLKSILNRDRYPSFQAREFILGMMKQFELAFQIGSSNQFLVPDLLSEDEQKINGFRQSLSFEYRYRSFFPSNVFSRFIVRQHEKIKDRENELWRNGVVIYFDGLRALVQADGPSNKITIDVEGESSRRRELMAIIRATFDEIHNSFAKLRVRAMVPIPDEPDAAVSYKALLKHEADGKDEIYVEDLDDFVPVAPLLLGVDGEKSNRELLALIRDRFNVGEINALMFELGIDYEEFEGYTKGKMQYAIDLLRYLQRQGKVEVLLAAMRRDRPDIRGI